MTSRNQTKPIIDSIVTDLWRSFFGTTLGALRGALRGRRA
jgi:hypothetical protein